MQGKRGPERSKQPLSLQGRERWFDGWRGCEDGWAQARAFRWQDVSR